jgi:hypothetical protein
MRAINVTFRHWLYTCDKCGDTGSCPIDVQESMSNCIVKVREAHASFNPKCESAYQGRWMRIIAVTDGKRL